MLQVHKSIRPALERCGYTGILLRENVQHKQAVVPYVGFANDQADMRSSCVTVFAPSKEPQQAVEQLKGIGSPIVFTWNDGQLFWWKQEPQKATLLEIVQESDIDSFFDKYGKSFSPQSVLRAKTRGLLQSQHQLSFVDLGLMPVLEKEAGETLSRLIEQSVFDLQGLLFPSKQETQAEIRSTIKTVFWLLSSKILRDKQVPAFQSLALNNAQESVQQVSLHFGTQYDWHWNSEQHTAIEEIAKRIERFGNMSLVTTEAIAHVYENTLVTEQARLDFGIYSTPQFLVDYVVGELAEWIEELPEENRVVFEPACGHAAFLVAASRLLVDLLPLEKQQAEVRGPYLRSCLHGVDVDEFALDLARLSLTLADTPNPDGWNLEQKDAFLDEYLPSHARRSHIVLANPPFKNVSAQKKQNYLKQGGTFDSINPTTEMLWQTIPHLPPGGLFGIVVPQGFLDNRTSQRIRQFLTERCELKEICLLPDNVFTSDVESAVLVGRVVEQNAKISSHVSYRRVREQGFEPSLQAILSSPKEKVSPTEFRLAEGYRLRLPLLREIWAHLAEQSRLGDFYLVVQGLQYHGKHLPKGSITYQDALFHEGKQGFVHFGKDTQIHSLPKTVWMNLAEEVIGRTRSGTTIDTPQVLLNYHRVSRGPWRCKALIDRHGHPVTSTFATVRPQPRSNLSLELAWALLNSPMTNAYLYANSTGRDNLVGTINAIPFPRLGEENKDLIDLLSFLVSTYVSQARSSQELGLLQKLLSQIDRIILDLYNLPKEMEEALLRLFDGYQRAGVPFEQTSYLSIENWEPFVNLQEFLAMTKDWECTNSERGQLIHKKYKEGLTNEEMDRFQVLQAYSLYYTEKTTPRPLLELKKLEEQLRAESSKRGQ